MQRLKRINKLESKINISLKILCGILAVAIIIVGISYAVYESTDEVLFINAKVGEFKESELQGDINLALKLDGEDVEVPPSKDNYIVTVECDYAEGTWDNERWLAEIGNITSNRVKCEVNFKTPEPTLTEVTATSGKTSIELTYTSSGVNVRTTCKWGTEEGVYPNEVEGATNTNCNIKELKMGTIYYYQVCAKNIGGETCKEGNVETNPETAPISIVEVGDYIRMTPTSTSYTISKSLTGYSTDQTINPSELNLWRVIRKNEDGTVDAVSEYVSSTDIKAAGETIFIYYVNLLENIASQYTNELYVQSTRNVGYNGQVLICPAVDGRSCPSDELYKQDVDLIALALNTLKAKDINTNEYEKYMLSSRLWIGSKGSLRGVTKEGVVGEQWGSGWILSDNRTINLRVRPIITFKSTIEIVNGDGTSAETAYQLV